jgi:hypothetical protein
VSYALQFISKFNVVVYLAVKNQRNLPVIAGHRLRAALNVNNGKAAVAEVDLVTTVFGLTCPKAGAIRPPVREAIGQALENISTGLPVRW